jgi:hypothetical protein
MKMEEDKYIEKLVDQIMKDQTLESPSFDFTSKLMAQIIAAKTNEVKVYKPLISKPVWIGIIGSIVLLFTYNMLYGNQPSNGLLAKLNFNSFYVLHLGEMFHFSKVATYSVVLSTLLFFIQIPLLKNYFNSKYSL